MVEQRRDEARHRLPDAVGGPGELPRRLGAERQRAEAAPPGQGPDARQPVREPEPADRRRLLRAVDVPLRGPLRRARGRRPADRAPGLADHRRADRHRGRPELGRRPRRLARLRRERPEPRGADRAGAGRPARARAARLLLPAADLQPLRQPELRRRLPGGRDLQARRGRRGAPLPGEVPGLADVHLRLPLQEDLLQLVDREVREVRALLPADRDRPGAGVLPLLRRAHPLHGPAPLRRRPDHRGRARRRRRPRRRAPLDDLRPVRPRGDRGREGERHHRRADRAPRRTRRSTSS